MNITSEYIERKALLKDISESVVFTARTDRSSLEIRGANKIINRIKSAPAADVVEVVRCKDCKYGKGNDYEGNIKVPFMYHCTYDDLSYNGAEHFCSYGKRKEGAEE